MKPEDINYSDAELSAVFSNLAKGSEKQYNAEMAGLYQELSSYYREKSKPGDRNDFESLDNLVEEDLTTGFSEGNTIAGKNRDRGALRALKWAEQVSRIIKSHVKKLSSGSTDFFENKNVYVCEICGFIFAGNEKPEICPVCKVPNFKMTQIRRSA